MLRPVILIPVTLPSGLVILLRREPDADTAEGDQGEEGELLQYSINNIEILSATVELEDERAQTRHILSDLEFALSMSVTAVIEPVYEHANNFIVCMSSQNEIAKFCMK